MNRKSYFLAIALILVSIILFSACNTETGNTETTTIAESSTTDSTTTRRFIPFPADAPKATEMHPESETVLSSEAENPITTKVVSAEKVEENNNGLTIIAKTTPVSKGNTANIIIYGTPGAKYSLEFYDSPSEVAEYDDITEATANENGLASWTFKIRNDCESGDRKIIVKEKSSDKFAQTFITVS